MFMDLLNANFIERPTIENDQNFVEISEEFYKKMKTRRSIRNFSSQPIDKEIIYNAIKTAGSAPSGANRQPWFFVLITDQAIKEKIRQAAEQVEREFYNEKAPIEWIKALKPFGTNSIKSYLTEAPALIAIFSRSCSEAEDGILQRSYYPVESVGIATGFLITALHHAGLATLTHTPKPMSFLNEVLELDKTFRPFMIVVTGYPQIPIQVPDISRKAFKQIFKEY